LAREAVRVQHSRVRVHARRHRSFQEKDKRRHKKITADLALKFAESLAKGTPNRTKMALTLISDKVRELV
jgi:hypothetical protein